MTLLAKRYATALFEVAQQAGAVDAVAQDLRRLHAALADPEVRGVVLEPDTPASARSKAADALLQGAHELSQSFVHVVLERRRQEILPGIATVFDAMLREGRGEELAVVQTARPLGPDEQRQVAAAAQALTGKSVTLEVQEAPELLGGMRLRVGNTLFDGSVATALDELRQDLLAAPI